MATVLCVVTACNVTARQSSELCAWKGLVGTVGAEKEFLTSCVAGGDPAQGAELLPSCPTTSSESKWLTHYHSFGMSDLVNAPHANI